MLALDVRLLQRDGLLAPGKTASWCWSLNGENLGSIQIRAKTGRVTLHYRTRISGNELQTREYPVFLEWTGCTYGGQRPWFLCPGRDCGRRVAILFGGSVFACRHCHQLAYPSQRTRFRDPAMLRADRIRKKLNWTPGIFNGDGVKPKGMHWKTFNRLKAEHTGYVLESMMAMEDCYERYERELARIEGR
ncbi:hypothetical protein [Metapseudomonas boanensis]|uniref:Uncharacterized protein n=1 Tax=Metapseudomonas boanensis TaxID=2822138 RepID=A0ABS5XGB9_9GAMM|nr:hypothetical protein [Pseudomonas boanensis]MBT8766298.1 hypothetical protein [Pseudomonas boanensis]